MVNMIRSKHLFVYQPMSDDSSVHYREEVRKSYSKLWLMSPEWNLVDGTVTKRLTVVQARNHKVLRLLALFLNCWSRQIMRALSGTVANVCLKLSQ